MNALAVPSNLAKLVPITVVEDAPRVRVFDEDKRSSTLKSNENDADTVVSLSCEASGSIASVATTGKPYDAPVMIRTLTLESDFHSVVSQADPPKRAVGEYSTRPKFSPNVVAVKEPDVCPFTGLSALSIWASYE
jgi:hypothetical protein